MKIDTAKGFYSFIKKKSVGLDEADDREAIAALEDVFQTHTKAADEDKLSGPSRDNFFFWKGAMVGMYINSKAYLQHYQKSAHEQGLLKKYDN